MSISVERLPKSIISSQKVPGIAAGFHNEMGIPWPAGDCERITDAADADGLLDLAEFGVGRPPGIALKGFDHLNGKA